MPDTIGDFRDKINAAIDLYAMGSIGMQDLVNKLLDLCNDQDAQGDDNEVGERPR